MRTITGSLIAVAFAAGAAQAQDAPAHDAGAHQDHASQHDPATAQPALPAETGAVSEGEVESFAVATIQLQAVAEDPALDGPAKQQEMVRVVTQAGLQPERYNEIGQATGSDPELLARIQTAVERLQSQG